MTDRQALKTCLKNHFLENQRVWIPGLLLVWATLNTLLLATNTLMEARRRESNLAWWEPFCWEISSVVMILVCFWPIVRLHAWLQVRFSLGPLVFIHALLTLVYSLVHVTGMVALRELWYHVVGWNYIFGSWGYEFLYEYRKDAASYLIILTVISCYQFVVRRLHGEASYIDEGENSSRVLPDRLLVKKLGKEFLISVENIRWVEASGNYANLHVNGSVYPMRITMAKLETLLSKEKFLRVHRSIIVNMDCVSHIQPLESGDYRISLQGGEELTLSRRYKEAFRDAMAATG